MFLKYINQPYPTFKRKWHLIIYISLFISLFMFVFQPFGLATIQFQNKILILFGYGAVTFVVLLFNMFVPPLVLNKTYTEKNWTLKKQLIWVTWILFTIGIGNFLYTAWLISSFYSFKVFIIFQFYTLTIGAIPIFIITILKNNQLLRENLKSATELNAEINTVKEETFEKNNTIALYSENDKEKLEIIIADILFIESVGNYVEISFVKDNTVQKSLMRSSLKRIETQLESFPEILKCHRAFLVNKHNIVNVNGNSQGLKLQLKSITTEIPVSRNFVKELKEKLKT